jgi:prepilin-type N-terminal cleavage/methylation domain-containing protein
MRNTKNAFTLVELIVVITILAILGTIAFISLQGYSADARNSKRTSDLGNIQSAISLKQVEGVPLMSFVTTNADNVITSIALAGSGAYAPAASIYTAGTPSYSVLNVAEKDFKDPQGDKAYRIGATTLKAGAFQLSATMEKDGTDTALVNGTFVARGTGTTHTGTVDGATFTVEDAAANYYKVGDIITGLTGATKVIKVSRNGVTLTVDGTISAATNINIAVDETAGLIGSSAGTDALLTPVENLSTTALAY